MTNKQRQVSLDKQKWLESEKKEVDLSGHMAYCEYCDYEFLGCDISQEERVEKCLCAKAYNRMVRGAKK